MAHERHETARISDATHQANTDRAPAMTFTAPERWPLIERLSPSSLAVLAGTIGLGVGELLAREGYVA